MAEGEGRRDLRLRALSGARRVASRTRLGVGALVALVVVAFGVTVLVSMLSGHGATLEIDPAPSGAPTDAGRGSVTDPPEDVTALYVHVEGAVQSPGVYQLTPGDRVIDAIAAAGGFSADADQSAVNLARFVVDGEQIVVAVPGATVPVAAAPPDGVSGVIDLNTATIDQLESLPRVGPALAERIVDWREANGGFSSVDDLLDVAGIGEKTLEGFRDRVRV